MLTFSLSIRARSSLIGISSSMWITFYPSVVTVVESARLELTSRENRVCICWIG
ncbi:hypothetical protein LINPERPRIM_LOCUS1050 [Linum perenne]